LETGTKYKPPPADADWVKKKGKPQACVKSVRGVELPGRGGGRWIKGGQRTGKIHLPSDGLMEDNWTQIPQKNKAGGKKAIDPASAMN